MGPCLSPGRADVAVVVSEGFLPGNHGADKPSYYFGVTEEKATVLDGTGLATLHQHALTVN
jgi:hypothetical protein